jgi:hypothetical protein
VKLVSSSTNRLRIVVLGSIVRLPMGGIAWHHLQFVWGLARLGHDVYFVEDSNDYSWSCYDPSRHVCDTDPTYGLHFAEQLFERVGLGERWAYYDAHRSMWCGPCADRALAVCESADVLVNLGHSNPLRAWFQSIPVRVLVDTDPAFTQVRHLTDAAARKRAAGHTAFFSFGENIGRNGCSVPSDGFRWQPIRQPIVLDAWPVAPGPASGRFTTVMQWDSYRPREYNGIRYGMKSQSFETYMTLPTQTGAALELTIGGASAPLSQLRENGWGTRNPTEIAQDPWTYQRYLQQSKAEFTVAKHGYVVSRSGWFSERSAGYLASSRPVVTEETGFSDWLPVGEGLFAFRSAGDACAAIHEVNCRYELHCQRAREIAEAYFDARKVLAQLVAQAMDNSEAKYVGRFREP